MITLKGENIYLRALEPNDLEFVYAMENDQSIWEVSNTQTPYSRFLVKQYLEGLMTLDEVQDRFCTLDWRLAKRQLTWLRRNPEIVWCELDEAYSYVVRQLADVIHL